MRIHMFSATSVGRIRRVNQDSIAFDETLGYGVVADGIGGKPGGEIASQITTQTIASRFYSLNIKFSEIADFMLNQVLLANQKILQFGHTHPRYKGLGTTLDFVYFAGEHLHLVHLGDSRTYLYLHDHLFQLTIDHNIETLSQRSPRYPQRRNMKMYASRLTNGLGFKDNPKPAYYQKKISPGEIYITASDGLFDMVEDTEIKNIIFHNSDNIENIPKLLVEQANLNGGRDNTSVLLASITSR